MWVEEVGGAVTVNNEVIHGQVKKDFKRILYKNNITFVTKHIFVVATNISEWKNAVPDVKAGMLAKACLKNKRFSLWHCAGMKVEAIAEWRYNPH